MPERPHRRRQSLEYMRLYTEENRDELNKKSRERKAANPERQRAAKLKERYGMTLEDYDTMLSNQAGGCAICASPVPKRKGSTRLVVDHCHKTGVVRGLLCYRCNVGLGNFEDDPVLVLKALKYLGGIV